jgi:hypothetical protein
MNDRNKREPKADDLVKCTGPESIELTEEDLERVSGGDFSFTQSTQKSSPL